MKRTVFALAAALAAAAFGQELQNSIQTVIGSGRNADYRTAIYEALVQAASQVQGVSLQDSRDAFMDSGVNVKTTRGEKTDTSEIRESLRQSVSAVTKGRVLNFRITAETYNTEMSMWFIELEAKVPGQYTVGLPEGNRRRMTVMPFRVVNSPVRIDGVKTELGAECAEIAEKLNQALVQTRRFTMLERENLGLVEAELARLNDPNAFAGDAARSQQLLVTDYLVTGTVKAFERDSTPVVNPYTGTATVPDGPALEVNYRVILAPTAQLKWAGSVVIPYSECAAGSADETLGLAYAAAARRVCGEIIENIYPMRVTGKTTYELVLNQGGTNVREGEAYDVLAENEEIEDVYSGESLGAVEEMVARVRITRVTPKMSYAVVVEGTPLESIEIGSVVRAPRGGAYGVAPAGQSSPVKVSAGGTVAPPWRAPQVRRAETVETAAPAPVAVPVVEAPVLVVPPSENSGAVQAQ